MSEVYLAYDEQKQRDVAIKVVSSTHADYIERFQREAEAITRLQHAHILPAFDYGEQEPWHYLVMPYIEHGTLRERLQEGPLSLEEAGVILEEIAGALQFAHNQGIVHRDIKPSNILLKDDHYAYLADFGLAKSLDGGGTITQTGNLMGTPEYMAPELSEGPAATSSDLYALGILLYQMVTGEVPFTGETPVAVYWKQLRDEPTPPSHINPAIPRSVERVILRALEKQPLRRYQSANELAEAYINAITFPDQVEEKGLPIRPFLQETTPVHAESLTPVHPSLQEGRLVLPDNPMAAPSAIPSSRRGFARRVVPNIARRRSGRLAPSTPPPMEALTPTGMRNVVSPPSLEQPAQLGASGAPALSRPPRRRRRTSSTRQRQSRNPFVASLVVMGVLLLLVILLFSYLANKANMQAQIAIATANANATKSAQVANAAATQQAQASATAGVASTATSGTLILSDALVNNINGHWAENAACVFNGSAYHVIAQQSNFLQSCSSNAFSFGNAAIQVDVSLLSGDDAGLIFRANGSQFYDFEITSQGQFFLHRQNGAAGTNYISLIQNTSNSAIVSGGGKNTLLVITSGDDFKLFINNIFVGEVHDSALVSGQIGFAAGTLASTSSAEGSFSNLRVFKV